MNGNENEIFTSPRVGAFYVLSDGIITDAISVYEAEPYGDFRVNGAHWELWDKIVSKRKIYGSMEYDTMPRGRVSYNINEDTYHVLVDKCLDNPGTVDLIVDEFNIRGCRLKVLHDSHYVCKRCRKSNKY